MTITPSLVLQFTAPVPCSDAALVLITRQVRMAAVLLGVAPRVTVTDGEIVEGETRDG